MLWGASSVSESIEWRDWQTASEKEFPWASTPKSSLMSSWISSTMVSVERAHLKKKIWLRYIVYEPRISIVAVRNFKELLQIVSYLSNLIPVSQCRQVSKGKFGLNESFFWYEPFTKNRTVSYIQWMLLQLFLPLFPKSNNSVTTTRFRSSMSYSNLLVVWGHFE